MAADEHVHQSMGKERPERIYAFLDALEIRAQDEFDVDFAKRAARQLSLAAHIVEMTQGLTASPHSSFRRHGQMWPPANKLAEQAHPSGLSDQIETRAGSAYIPEFSHELLVDSEEKATADYQVVEGPYWKNAQAVQRAGVLSALIVTFMSTALLLVSLPIGLAGMYVGLTVFFASQFAAHQVDEYPLIVAPDLAAIGFAGSLGLVATAISAALWAFVLFSGDTLPNIDVWKVLSDEVGTSPGRANLVCFVVIAAGVATQETFRGIWALAKLGAYVFLAAINRLPSNMKEPVDVTNRGFALRLAILGALMVACIILIQVSI